MEVPKATVVNIRKKELIKRNIADFQEWNSSPNTVYIGRNQTYHVPGTIQSKWKNPFSVKQYGREESLRKYREYIINNKELLNSLHELLGKELGCWCHPEKCHGDVLVELLEII